MKKIALLFALLCVGQLYGMQTGLSKLPREVQVLVIQALASGNDVQSTVKAIKNVSLVNKQLNYIINEQYSYTNLRQFTALMDLLASKFPKEDRYDIAKLFGGPIANEYIRLGKELFEMCSGLLVPFNENYLPKLHKLVEQGADPNFTMHHSSILAAIIKSYDIDRPEKKEILKLALIFLLENGANPYAKYSRGQSEVFNDLQTYSFGHVDRKERDEILEVLKPYMK